MALAGKGKLGHDMGNILSLTTVPSIALAITATRYVDLNFSAGDEQKNRPKRDQKLTWTRAPATPWVPSADLPPDPKIS